MEKVSIIGELVLKILNVLLLFDTIEHLGTSLLNFNNLLDTQSNVQFED